MSDSRETSAPRAFVAGYPVHHSRSPIIHRYWLDCYGIKGRYERCEIKPAEFGDFVAALKSGSSGFVGGNITIPHKEEALRFSDSPDDLAREIGAANTLWLEEGRLHATNTDAFGFLANLDASCPGWDKASRAVVLGAGGASRAVLHAVRSRGINEIHVVNRTVSRARELADRFGPHLHAHPLEALAEVMRDAGLFINTTSLGMDSGEAPVLDFSRLRSDALVTDIVYVPLVTPLLAQAQAQGLRVADGLGMLLHQAVLGFEKWFGVRPTVDGTLRALVLQDMGSH